MRRIVKIRETVLGDGVPKICIPVTAANQTELQEQVRKALDGPCDLLEWRADFFGTCDAAEIQAQLFADTLKFLRAEIGERPLIFTFRTKEEGGERSVTPEAYKELNLSVASTGLAERSASTSGSDFGITAAFVRSTPQFCMRQRISVIFSCEGVPVKS